PPVISVADETPAAGEPVEIRIDQPARDEDGDAVSLEYTWTIDGVSANLPAGTTSVPPGKTRKGQRWFVMVTPNDAESAGPGAVVEFVPRNNPPMAPSIELIPATPTVLTGVSVRIARPALDRDQDPIHYRYAWYRNGKRVNVSRDAAALEPNQI